MLLPSIRLIEADATTELSTDVLQSRALRVPEDIARFQGQLAVPLEDLLGQQSPELQICCRGSRGECFSFPAEELSEYSLLSTNSPGWKLVPAGRRQLATITTPRFVLRDVASIEIGRDLAAQTLSDQVYTNLTDALLSPNRVRFLSLTSAGLERFPTGVLELSNLETLNLGNNAIASLPPDIGEMRQLKVLKLSRNRLRSLPEEIGRLKALLELHVSRNQLSSLPEKLWNLSELQLLNLGENQLTTIPNEIAQLSRLRQLELTNNPIAPADRLRIANLVPHATIEW
jgi:Leucine-rich repeat (LRR) protein